MIYEKTLETLLRPGLQPYAHPPLAQAVTTRLEEDAKYHARMAFLGDVRIGCLVVEEMIQIKPDAVPGYLSVSLSCFSVPLRLKYVRR